MSAAVSHDFLDLEIPSVHSVSRQAKALAEQISPPPLPQPPPQLPALHESVSAFTAAADNALVAHHGRLQIASENLHGCAASILEVADAAEAIDADNAAGFEVMPA